jgi:uncharacterized membrane protein
MTMAGSSILVGLFMLGLLTGLRTLAPIAVLCWMTMLGRIPVAQGWMGFVSSKISVGVFSVAALGELIGDKLPTAPSRTQGLGLIARIVFGGLSAAIFAAAAGYSAVFGAVIGAAGAVVGTFGGWFVRTRTVSSFQCPDFPIALIEDAVAVGGSILVCLVFRR